jgi:nicotinamidase/pyrazinamidase
MISRKLVFWDVDTQFDFLSPEGKLFVPGSQEIIDKLWDLTSYGKSTGYLMSGSVDAHISNDPEFQKWPEHCAYGTPGQVKIPQTKLDKTLYIPSTLLTSGQLAEVVAYDGQIIFEKQTTDCRTNSNIKPWLDRVNPRRIAVYGVVSEICVDKAVNYLAGDLGYPTVVIEDAIKELKIEHRKECAKRWKDLNVELVTTEHVLRGGLTT